MANYKDRIQAGLAKEIAVREEQKEKVRTAKKTPQPLPENKRAGTGKFVGQALYTGLTSGNKGLAQTADFFLPDALTPAAVQKGIDYYKEVGKKNEEKLAAMSDTKGRQFTGQLLSSAVNMAPNVALAFLSGGSSLAAQGGALAAEGGAALTARTALANAAKGAAKNPMFISSALQTLGPTYEKEREAGASELQAGSAALANAILGSAVETSGGIETFKKGTGILKNALRTAGEEGLEEAGQYSIENLTNKAFGSGNAKWFSTDETEDAVINPMAQAKAAATGAILGGVMGGGQAAAGRVLTDAAARAEKGVKTGPQPLPEAKTAGKNASYYMAPETQKMIFDAVEKRSGARIQFADLPEGIDGSYENGVITVSNKAKNPAYTVLRHELTHHIEKSGDYQALSDFIVKNMRERGDDVDAQIRSIIEDYAKIGQNLTPEQAKKEYVAKFSEEYLFNSEKSIERLARENPNLFQRIYDWIVDTIAKMGADANVKFLIDAQRKYEKALRTVGKSTYTGPTLNGKQLMYAGVNSQLADESMKQKAIMMELEGADPETIRRETKWFRGDDSKWRFEFSDKDMEVFPNGDALFRQNHPEYVRLQDLYQKFWDGTITEAEMKELESLDDVWGNEYGRLNRRLTQDGAYLEDVIKHDELFANYPLLRRIPYRLRDLEFATNGQYRSSDGSIEISNSVQNSEYLREKLKDTLVHEIQHAIQDYEDFASGASPEFYENVDFRENDYRVGAAEERYRTLYNSAPEPLKNKIRSINAARLKEDYDTALNLEEELLNSEYADLYSEIADADFERRGDRGEKLSAYELYRNTAGEKEARDAASRRLYDESQRAAKRPDVGGFFVRAENFAGDGNSAYDDAADRKRRQFEIINAENPAPNSYNTWIRSPEDVKTFDETLTDSDWEGWEESGFNPDWSGEDAKRALQTGKVTVYSSYPIKQGVFVSPSRMEAESYSGNGKVYSKTVNLEDVAWIDPTQGQFAKIDKALQQKNVSIEKGMGSSERYEILKNRSITIPAAKPNKLLDSQKQSENNAAKAITNFVKKHAEELGLRKEYSHNEIDIDFVYSNAGIQKSVNTMAKNKQNLKDYLTMLSVFDEVINSAVLVEKHAPKKSTDRFLKSGNVLLGGFINEEGYVIPVELEIKETSNEGGRLYLAVSIGNKKAKVTDTRVLDNSSGPVSTSATISLADLIGNVNPTESYVLKYFPKEFLDAEQNSGRIKGMLEDVKKYDQTPLRAELDEEYLKTVEGGNVEDVEKMTELAAQVAGYDRKLYHQTGATFTEFNTENQQAGKYDSELPTGIFMKPTPEDIGLRGKNQMGVYAKMKNPLTLRNREHARYYWMQNVPGYEDALVKLQQIDAHYKAEHEKATKQFRDFITEWRKNNPNAERKALYEVDEFNRLFEREDEVVDEWEAAANEARLEAKALIDKYIAGSNFDGVILEEDQGSFGRKVKSYIVMDPRQVKSSDPVTYDNNLQPIPLSERFNKEKTDIRYSGGENLKRDAALYKASQTLYKEKGNRYIGYREPEEEAPATAEPVRGEKKATSYQRRAKKNAREAVKSILGVSKFADAKKIDAALDAAVEKMKTHSFTSADQDALFDEMFSEGIVVNQQMVKEYANLKQTLRNTQLHVTADVAKNITDFDSFRKSNLNNIRLSNDTGLEIDSFYEGLQEEYPALFPDLNTPAEMLQRISEVGKSIKQTENRLQDMYDADFEEFYAASKAAFGREMERLQDESTRVTRYLKDKNRKISVADAKARIEEIGKLRKEADKVKAKELLSDVDKTYVEMLHKGTLDERGVRYLTPLSANAIMRVYAAEKPLKAAEAALKETGAQTRAEYRQLAEQMLEGSERWKDKKSGFRYARETAERNMRDIAGKSGDKLVKAFFEPVHKAEAVSVKMKNDLRKTVKALNISTKDEYDVTDLILDAPGLSEEIAQARAKKKRIKVSESTLVQLYGEGLITKEDLAHIRANVDKIESSVSQMRTIYNQLIDAANRELVRHGYEPIEYRQNYFPHFTEDKPDGLLANIANKLGFNIVKDELPTDIAGLTHTFRPGKKWFGNALQRTSRVTEYDAVKGFDIYLEGIADVIHHTENIQKLRQLENELRYRYSTEGVKTEINNINNNPELSEVQKQAMLDQVFEKGNTHLSNLAVWLRSYTDNLAGKKAQIDRTFEHNIGRGLYNTSKAVENRVAANMVAVNPGSWLTNLISLIQGSEVKNSNIIKGMAQTINNHFNHDGVADASAFVTNRKGSDVLWKSTTEVWQDRLTKPMQVIDSFVSESLVRARYLEELDKGRSPSEAMRIADEFAAGVIADRSKGALPTAFNAKNPVSKILTMYQVEVNNQWSHIFKDIPRTEENVMKVAWTYTKFAVAAYIFNDVYEFMVGRRPALDPLSWVNEFVGDVTGKQLKNFVEALFEAAKGEGLDLTEEKEEKGLASAVTNLGENVAENIPFVGGLLGGGRVPIQSALPDFSTLTTAAANLAAGENGKKALSDMGKELLKPAAYMALPMGGGQVKKLGETALNYARGGNYAINSDGERELRFAVDKGFLPTAQSALFGQYSGKNAVKYVEGGFKRLSAKKTAAFESLIQSGVKPTDAEDFLRGLPEKKSDVKNAIMNSGYTVEQKNAIGKALYPEDNLNFKNKAELKYSALPDESKAKVKGLKDAGLTTDSAMKAYEVQKKYSSDVEKAYALMEQEYYKEAVLNALEISDGSAGKAKALRSAGVSLDTYNMAKTLADTNGNGVSKEEAIAYFKTRSFSKEEKYALLKALTSVKDKNIPYK